MSNFSCNFCNKIFQYESHYYKHLKFSKCLRNLDPNTISNIIKNNHPKFQKNIKTDAISRRIPSPKILPQKNEIHQIATVQQKTKDKPLIQCSCGTSFTTKSNFQRHRLSSCPLKKNEDDNMVINAFQEPGNIHSYTVTDNNENNFILTEEEQDNILKKLNLENKKIGQYHEKMDQNQNINYGNEKQPIIFNINYICQKVDIKKKKINQHLYINTNHKSTKIIEEEDETVKINDFGKENTKYIEPTDYKNIFQNPYNCLLKLISDIHFNPYHPENMNIKRLNARSKFVDVFLNGTWNKTPISNVLHNLLNSKMDQMDIIAVSLMPDETDEKRKTYEHFANNICSMLTNLSNTDDNLSSRQLSKYLEKDNKVLYHSLNNYLDNQITIREKLP